MEIKELMKYLPTGNETRDELSFRLRVILKYLIETSERHEELLTAPKTTQEVWPAHSNRKPNALHELPLSEHVAKLSTYEEQMKKKI